MEDFYDEELDCLKQKLLARDLEIARLKAQILALKTVMEGRYILAKQIAEESLGDAAETGQRENQRHLKSDAYEYYY